MEFCGFACGERVCAAAGIEFCVPHGFAGVDVADTADAGLIEKKFFERAAGLGEELGEKSRGEFFCESVYAERFEAARGFAGFEEVDAAEVATIGETEDAAIEFKGDVNVDVVGRAVGFGFEIARGGEPEKLAVEAEMQGEESAIELEKKIFAVASNGADGLVLGGTGKLARLLRLGDDWVQDLDDTNFLPRTSGRKVWATASTSGSSGILRVRDYEPRFQREPVAFCFRFGGIGERLRDGFAIKPVGELVCVMAAAGLATLAAGNEHERLIPICRICDETHGGAVRPCGGARTVARAGLRAVRKAQKEF